MVAPGADFDEQEREKQQVAASVLRDALIIEAAHLAGCEQVLTEGLTDGQVIRGVRVHNPFLASS